MREPRPIAGARMPLFERLVDEDRTMGAEAAPRRVLDRAALVASVTAEIGRLLNTRRPTPPERAGRDELWVLDYGVPDFGGRSAASVGDRESYAAELTRALTAFEPRLSQVSIVFEPAPGDPQRLVGTLRARLILGTVREPVSFPLLLHAGSGEVRFGDNPPAPSADNGLAP